MESVTQDQILEVAVTVSFYTNILVKRQVSVYSSPNCEQIVGQIRLFSFS